MRKNTPSILITFLAILFSSCQQKEQVAYKQNKDLTKQEVSILDELTVFFATGREVGLPKGSDMKRIFKKLDDYQLVVLPIYELNVEEYYKNPKSESIMEYMTLPKNKLNITGRKKGNLQFRLNTKKDNGRWIPELFYGNWGKQISWLEERLKNNPSEKAVFFTCFSEEMIWIKTASGPVFYTLEGEVTPDDEFLKEIGKKIKEMDNSNRSPMFFMFGR